MKKIMFILAFVLSGCALENPLTDFRFQTTMAPPYVVASWHKISKPGEALRVYIEGDGNSFNAQGRPTNNPTPKSTFLRDIAANDPHANVAYLARPCQYFKTNVCQVTDWTTGRFSPQIIESMDTSLHTLMKKAGTDKVTIIGYSGGAQVAGLLGVRNIDSVDKIITIAGVLDHQAWTNYFGDTPLTKSLNLAQMKQQFNAIPQHHYIGGKDKVVPNQLTYDFVEDKSKITLVKNADHQNNYNRIIKEIYAQ